MLQFFRSMTRSRIGGAVAIGVLVLIALAFASGDIAGTGGFGGVAGGDRVATVGDSRISTSALAQAATSALEQVKQQQPTMSMKAFVANGGLEKTLNDLIDRVAVAEFGKKHGIVAGDRLIDSEITQIPAFKGPDGSFSQELFRQAIRQRGLDERTVREDLAQGLVARQVLLPAAYGSIAPRELARRYAALLTESRNGAIALFPSPAFVAGKEPTDAELEAYYRTNRDRFIRPERRVIRYASFGADALKDVPEPTEAEIAARYEQNKGQYAARETRSATQLIVPTEAAAKAVIAEVSQGTSLEAAARQKGLGTVPTGAKDRAAMAQQTSPAVAAAVFAAPKGQLATPAKSALGWHVMRIDSVETRAARPLDAVRDEIAQAIAAERRRLALNTQISRIEDEFDEGGNLADAAKRLGVSLERTQPVTADGQVYLKADATVPEALKPILATAFAMEQENEPQIAEVEPGKRFMIFDVAEIQASAPAPLAEIRADVAASYLMKQGFDAAEAAAKKVQSQVRKGEDFGKAVAGLGKRLPPVQLVNMSREELAQMQQRGTGDVPPPLGLMFSMAEGTIKLLPAPEDRGWFIVQLRDIVPGKVAEDDPILASAETELGQVIGDEYANALSRAIRAEVGVERNKAGIQAVEKQLTGGS